MQTKDIRTSNCTRGGDLEKKIIKDMDFGFKQDENE
jgi:hypothetical protein